MKKLFLMLTVALLAVACNKNDGPEKTGINLISDQIVTVDDTGIVTIKFDAYENWTASLEFDEGEESFAQISASKGEKGEGQKINVTVEDLPSEVAGRCFAVILTTPTDLKEVLIFQGKVFAVTPIGSDTVGTNGGKVEYSILTNCTNVEVKKYDGPDGTFAWAPATYDASEHSLVFDIQANEGYDSRSAYVKFTVNDIVVDETALVVKAYVYQEGRISVAWSNSISNAPYASALGVGAFARLGYDGTNIVLSAGNGNCFSLSPSTGASVSSANLGDAYTSFTTDDAGHVIFAKPAAYSASTDIYAVIGGTPKVVATISNADVYSFKAANFRVKGDVTANACICGLTDVYVYCIWTEIKGGVQADSGFFSLPAQESMNWDSQRNGCAMPLGSSIDAGVLYMGYDGNYTLCHVAKDGTSTPLFSYDENFGEGAGTNVNFQAIDVADWNGKQYAAVLVSTFFSWGEVPAIFLFNVTERKLVSHVYAPDYGIEVSYLGANDGENASADVQLIPGESLGVVVADVLSNVVFKIDYPKM